MNANSIIKSLGTDTWITHLSEGKLLECLNQFHEVEIQSATESIKLSRVTRSPQFLQIEQHISAPEAGISFSMNDITRTYITSGIQNHRDLSLHIHLDSEKITLNFNASAQHQALISNLTHCVTEAVSLAEANDEPQAHGKACPCCIVEKQKIRNTPTRHPLYWLLNHFTDSRQPLLFLHKSTSVTSDITITPESTTVLDGTVHLTGSGQHLAIPLTEVYNVRVHLELESGTSSTVLTAFNSFGHTTFEIKQENSESFHLWNSILQSHHKKALPQ